MFHHRFDVSYQALETANVTPVAMAEDDAIWMRARAHGRPGDSLGYGRTQHGSSLGRGASRVLGRHSLNMRLLRYR